MAWTTRVSFMMWIRKVEPQQSKNHILYLLIRLHANLIYKHRGSSFDMTSTSLVVPAAIHAYAGPRLNRTKKILQLYWQVTLAKPEH